jgi:hypothetical protein
LEVEVESLDGSPVKKVRAGPLQLKFNALCFLDAKQNINNTLFLKSIKKRACGYRWGGGQVTPVVVSAMMTQGTTTPQSKAIWKDADDCGILDRVPKRASTPRRPVPVSEKQQLTRWAKNYRDSPHLVRDSRRAPC